MFIKQILSMLAFQLYQYKQYRRSVIRSFLIMKR